MWITCQPLPRGDWWKDPSSVVFFLYLTIALFPLVKFIVFCQIKLGIRREGEEITLFLEITRDNRVSAHRPSIPLKVVWQGEKLLFSQVSPNFWSGACRPPPKIGGPLGGETKNNRVPGAKLGLYLRWGGGRSVIRKHQIVVEIHITQLLYRNCYFPKYHPHFKVELVAHPPKLGDHSRERQK